MDWILCRKVHSAHLAGVFELYMIDCKTFSAQSSSETITMQPSKYG